MIGDMGAIFITRAALTGEGVSRLGVEVGQRDAILRMPLQSNRARELEACNQTNHNGLVRVMTLISHRVLNAMVG